MSKSRGNVVDPDEQVRSFGADAVRAYLMFGYQWSEGGPWNTKNISGVVRWLHRAWAAVTEPAASPAAPSPADERALRRLTHQTIARVTKDLDEFQFNTIIAALMEFTNGLYRYRETTAGSAAWAEAVKTLVLLMAPNVPHIAEEVWERMGQPYSVHQQAWPVADESALAEDTVTIVVQVNARVRDRLELPAGATESQVVAAALASAKVRDALGGREPSAVRYVSGRLVNLVL